MNNCSRDLFCDVLIEWLFHASRNSFCAIEEGTRNEERKDAFHSQDPANQYVLDSKRAGRITLSRSDGDLATNVLFVDCELSCQ